MAILTTDLKYYQSGGAGNTTPDNSLGGIISTTEVADGALHGLFDIVDSAESTSGDTEYRCIYLKNTSALTLLGAYIYVSSNTTSTDTSISIALGSSAVNGTEQTVGNESTKPVGLEAFSTAAGSGNAITIGDIPAGQTKALWLERTVDAAAVAFSGDTFTIQFGGGTVA